MKFDVFLPSLLVSPDWFADSDPPRLPAIETILARGTLRVGGAWPTVLLPAFGAESADALGAFAAFAAFGDDLDTGARGWMFAEPAHFQADRDTLNLLPCAQLDISASEAVQLISALNANFSDRGLAFFRGASGYWYVSCDADELPQTTPIRASRRGAIFEKLPQSRGTLSWKAIQNEAQMLFHSHVVNDARAVAGKLSINGLWFWGEGVLPKMANGSKPTIGAVCGDIPLAKGLAKWVNARYAPVGQIPVADAAATSDHSVLVIDALAIPLERGDIPSWQEAVLKLDSNIFIPLLASLRAGTIDEVILTLPRDRDSLIFTINSQSLRGLNGWWKNFTKKTRPFLESSLA